METKLNRYKLPVSVSFIASEIHPAEDGNYEIELNIKKERRLIILKQALIAGTIV